MKEKFVLYLLGIYDFIIAVGAIMIGLRMISSPNLEYPQEWLTKVPFQNWFLPGIIGIIVFGFGNIIAAVYCFRNKGNAWLASTIMASIFFLSMILQYDIFKEWYLPSAMLSVLSIIQVTLCGIAVLVDILLKHKQKKANC